MSIYKISCFALSTEEMHDLRGKYLLRCVQNLEQFPDDCRRLTHRSNIISDCVNKSNIKSTGGSEEILLYVNSYMKNWRCFFVAGNEASRFSEMIQSNILERI